MARRRFCVVLSGRNDSGGLLFIVLEGSVLAGGLSN